MESATQAVEPVSSESFYNETQANNTSPVESGRAESDTASLQMETIYSIATIWTQTTMYIESGTAQLPEVTIYSSLQPIESASYPDPIMSATGADLQSLISQKHAQLSTTSVVEATSEPPVPTTSTPRSSSIPSPSLTYTPESAETTQEESVSTASQVFTSVVTAVGTLTLEEETRQRGTLSPPTSSSLSASLSPTSPPPPSSLSSPPLSPSSSSTSPSRTSKNGEMSSETTLLTIKSTNLSITPSTTPSTLTTKYVTTPTSESYSQSSTRESSADVSAATSRGSSTVTRKNTISIIESISVDGNTPASSTKNTVVPITAASVTLISDMGLITARDELAALTSPTSILHPSRDGQHWDPRSIYHTLDNVIVFLCTTAILLIIMSLVQFIRNTWKRQSQADSTYTSKPPRPGLRKRLSLSMTGGSSSNSTEATHVSGNSMSIGRSSGKGLVPPKVRRTPSTPLLEV